MFFFRSGLPGMGLNQQSLYHLGANTNSGKLRTMASGNIAAVEPYHHVPTATSYQQTSIDQDFIKQSDVGLVLCFVFLLVTQKYW